MPANPDADIDSETWHENCEDTNNGYGRIYSMLASILFVLSPNSIFAQGGYQWTANVLPDMAGMD